MCDLDPERAQAAAEQFGVPAFTDIDDVLALRPGIVSVATAEPHHVEPALAVLGAGIDLLCEKVMADSVSGAERIVAAAEASSARAATDYNYRFFPVSRAIRATLDDDLLGQVSCAAITTHSYCWHHTLDLVRFWFGEIVSVIATPASLPRRERPRASEELVYIPDPAVSAVLRTDSGVMVSLTSTLDSLLPESMIDVQIFGEHGRVAVERMRLDDVNGRVRAGTLTQVDGLDRPFSLDDSFHASIASVVEAERAGTGFSTTVADGLRVVRIEAALRRSVREGREVTL